MDFMRLAIREAMKARAIDEVPVGAVIVKDGKVLARGYNKRESTQNALHHAEIIAIDKACRKLGSWRLIDCDIYVTLEPCPMCMGAIINSRIRHIYFGAFDKKAGCCGSLCNLIGGFNHTPEVTSGLEATECAEILTEYFKSKRNNDKQS